MLFADDVALCSTRRKEVAKKLEEQRRAMEDRGAEDHESHRINAAFRDVDCSRGSTSSKAH